MDDISSNSMRDFMPSDTTADDSATPVDNSAEVVEVQEPSVQAPAEPEQTPEPTFANKFDPNKLSPELQTAYKLMQSDYTAKTQELANARKFHDSYAQYEPLLGYIAKNPQLAEQYLMGNNTPQPVEEPQVEYSDDPVEFANQVMEQAKKEAMQEFLSYLEARDSEQAYQQQIEDDIAEAEMVDPRLASDEESDREFADQVAAFVLTDEGVANGSKSYAQATREAVARVDALIARKLEADKQRLTEIAKTKRSPTASSSPTNTVAPGSTPKTMREAAAEFLK